MDRSRFEAIVAAYGADPRRWPEAERADAEAFARLPEAASALAEANALDAVLDEAADAAPVSLAFRRAALAAAPRLAPAMTWRPLAALAACALLGVVIGVGGARQAAEQQAVAVALDIAFGAGEVG